MNIREQYREFKEQWPEASKWAIPLWLGSAALVGYLGWGFIRDLNQPEKKSPSALTVVNRLEGKQPRPGGQEKARGVVAAFPADPELWQQAAWLLMGADPSAARELLAMAASVPRDSPSIAQDQPRAIRFDQPTAAWAARAFALEDDLEARPLLQSVLGGDEGKSREAEIKLRAICSGRPDRAAGFAGWLMLGNRWPEALSWMNGLAPAVADGDRIRALRTEILCHLGNIDSVRDALRQDAGGWTNPDAIDLALCACLAGQRGRSDLRAKLWSAALALSGADSAANKVLLHLSLGFGLDQESAQSFEAVLAQGPDDRETAAQYVLWKRLHRASPTAPPKTP